MNTCVSVDEGHLISLTVKFDLDAELDNKVGSFILRIFWASRVLVVKPKP